LWRSGDKQKCFGIENALKRFISSLTLWANKQEFLSLNFVSVLFVVCLSARPENSPKGVPFWYSLQVLPIRWASVFKKNIGQSLKDLQGQVL
jgi:hypothetical protein